MTHTLLHTTDLHLNFCGQTEKDKFYQKVQNHNPSSLVITGDISEAPGLINHLTELRQGLGSTLPIYFVAGNHDYYNGSIAEVRDKLSNPCNLPGNTVWLSACSAPIALTPEVALIGHDGWYDGGYADWFKSQLDMSDYYIIRELSNQQCPLKQLRFDKMNELAQESAEHVRLQLEEAHKLGFKKVFVAMHVAPFPELSTFKGKISDATWLPCFSSKRMGDVLCQIALTHLDMKVTVLCGHSHGKAMFRHSQNLDGHCGAATYGYPSVSNIFNI